MNITPDQARELLTGTTPGSWSHDGRVKFRNWRVNYVGPISSMCNCDGLDVSEEDADLVAAAPDLAQTVIDQAATIAGMTEEWGVETKSHQFGLHWEWYDNEAAAKKAHGYQVGIWRAGNRQKVMPIRRRFIMEVIEGE